MAKEKQVMTREQLKRQLLFVPCQTKEQLHQWIVEYFGVNFPTEPLDVNSGNKAPMDAIWDIYDHSVRNHNPKYTRALLLGARTSGKTLAASCIECLQALHAKRSIVHLAALVRQSEKCFEYVKNFLSKPIIRDFVNPNKNNKTVVEIVRYQQKNVGPGKIPENLTESQWEELSPSAQDGYERILSSIKIVTLTFKAANGEHAPSIFLDEADVIEGQQIRAYDESKMIPDQDQFGNRPLTVILSTRKSIAGLVQSEIDATAKTGLKTYIWNILDVTEECPAERHLPDSPKIPIYVDPSQLSAIGKEQWENLTPLLKTKYHEEEGFAGCLKNCTLFGAGCGGKLASIKRNPSNFYKKIDVVERAFADVSIDLAQAQLLCLKPSSEGLVYPRFNPDIHVISPGDAMSTILGEDPDMHQHMDVTQLVSTVKTMGAEFYTGMDYGFTHVFAAVTGFKIGNMMFIFDAFSVKEFELNQQIELCESRIKRYDPKIFADTAYPGHTKAFKREGFDMATWEKYKGSVVDSIEVVRSKLSPLGKMPELYIIKDLRMPNLGIMELVNAIQKWSWVLDTAGVPTEKPKEAFKDFNDAFRYIFLNVFSKKKRGNMQEVLDELSTQQEQSKNDLYWSQMMNEIGYQRSEDEVRLKAEAEKARKGKKSKLILDI